MITPLPLDSGPDVEKIVRNVLLSSKSWGKFPTPIEEIVRYTDLQIEKGVDLSKIEPGFFTKSIASFNRMKEKAKGMIDFKTRVVYLDQSQKEPRKNFITLHEVGHQAIGWQQQLKVHMDDDESLDPDTEEIFEREASFFASAALFQLEIFDDETRKLPLSIKSPMHLGQKFGGSNHAAIRRYVERSHKRCAVLVLKKPEEGGPFCVRIRDYFQSDAFTKEFGTIDWGSEPLGFRWGFVRDIQRKRRMHEDGQIAISCQAGVVTFAYHFFNNGHNTFILILPVGESIKSKTVILTKP